MALSRLATLADLRLCEVWLLMPVRGHGNYKRPYRVAFTEPSGRKVSKAFHWPAPWEREIEYLRSHKYDYRAWEDHTPSRRETERAANAAAT